MGKFDDRSSEPDVSSQESERRDDDRRAKSVASGDDNEVKTIEEVAPKDPFWPTKEKETNGTEKRVVDTRPGRRENPKAVHVTGYPSDMKSREISDLFSEKVSAVDRVDMKERYSFVIFKADDAQLAVDRMHGFKISDSDTLNVEVAMLKKTAPRVKPTDTLFVVNFDKDKTRDSDMEDFFKGHDYTAINMWRGGLGISAKNFCFVSFRSSADAERALNALDGQYLGDQQVTVEYRNSTPRSDRSRRGDRRDSPRRGRDRRDSPRRDSRRRDSPRRERDNRRDSPRRGRDSRRSVSPRRDNRRNDSPRRGRRDDSRDRRSVSPRRNNKRNDSPRRGNKRGDSRGRRSVSPRRDNRRESSPRRGRRDDSRDNRRSVSPRRNNKRNDSTPRRERDNRRNDSPRRGNRRSVSPRRDNKRNDSPRRDNRRDSSPRRGRPDDSRDNRRSVSPRRDNRRDSPRRRNSRDRR